jgi:hypothetical protein
MGFSKFQPHFGQALSHTLDRLSATVNAANSAQNCQNLPKSTHKRNFEIPPKIEILVFFKNKNFYV